MHTTCICPALRIRLVLIDQHKSLIERAQRRQGSASTCTKHFQPHSTFCLSSNKDLRTRASLPNTLWDILQAHTMANCMVHSMTHPTGLLHSSAGCTDHQLPWKHRHMLSNTVYLHYMQPWAAACHAFNRDCCKVSACAHPAQHAELLAAVCADAAWCAEHLLAVCAPLPQQQTCLPSPYEAPSAVQWTFC